MAKYRVLEKSYIHDTIQEEGAIVDYDGEPGPNLELIPEPEQKPEPAPAKRGSTA